MADWSGILMRNELGASAAATVAKSGDAKTGLVALGVLVVLLTLAGPISRFLQGVESSADLGLSGFVSLLAVVVVIAFVAGIAYGLVAIPAQTQLQEELPEDVRGRVFGILYMLVSVASFLPIIIVGQNVISASQDARAEADHITLTTLHAMNVTQLQLLEQQSKILDQQHSILEIIRERRRT